MWTYKTYAETIEKFLSNGYQVGSFEQIRHNPTDKFVVLRHDIDFDFLLLNPMLDIESKFGVTSTTFFRVAAKGYNFLSAQVSELLEQIQEAGSSSGLHLDIGIENCWNISIDDSADFQKMVFDVAAPVPMSGFSLHQPTKNGGYEFADSLVSRWGVGYHAYQKEFFQDIKYLSDSGGRWREGHWSEKIHQHNKLQVLTHPIWHHNGIPQRNF